MWKHQMVFLVIHRSYSSPESGAIDDKNGRHTHRDLCNGLYNGIFTYMNG